MKNKFLKEHVMIAGLVVLLLAVFFYDVVFLGKTFKITTANPQALMTGPYGQENNKPDFFNIFTTDVSLNEEPALEYIKRSFRKGVLPMWNPHLACGYPLIGLIQVGLFFPLNLLFYILPDMIAWDALIFGRFFLAGFFIYWFIRVLRLGRLPALGAVIIFMLSGPMVKLQAWMANVDILAPLLFLSFELLLKRRTFFQMGLTGLVIGLTILAGHPEHLVLVHSLAVLYLMFRVLSLRPRPPLIRCGLLLAGAYVIGFGLGAIVLLPFVKNWLTVFWHSHPADMGTKAEYAKEPRFYAAVLFPLFFQKFPISLSFDQAGWWGAMGILPFGLTFLGLWYRQRRYLNWFFAGVAFILLAKVFIDAPPFNWIGLIPIFRYFRFANHSAHQVAFMLAVGSAMGIRVIMLRRRLLWKSLPFFLPVVGVLAAALYIKREASYFPNAMQSAYLSFGVIAVFLILLFLKDKRLLTRKTVGLGVVLLVALEMFLYIPRGRVNRFVSFPDVPYIDFLKKSYPRSRVYGIFWTLYPNTATAYELDDFGIFHGLLCRRYVDFINQFVVQDHFTKDHCHTSFWVVPVSLMPDTRPFLDLVNVRYTVAPRNLKEFFIPARSAAFPQPLYSDEVDIYPHPTAYQRAFIVHRAIFEPDEEKVFELMRQHKDYLRALAVLNHPPQPEIQQQLDAAPVTDDSWAVIREYSPNEVMIDTRMQHAGLLILSDTYHPDWRAFVNGKPTQIYVTDHLLRSVFLPKGEWTVRFVFRPGGFLLGRWVSALFLIGLLMFLFLVRPSRRGARC